MRTKQKTRLNQENLKEQLEIWISPVVAIILLLVLWQILPSLTNSEFPPPSTVIKESGTLLIKPFANDGGQKNGLGWQILASLQRVAIGYSLAALVGISIGISMGTNRLTYRALDPICQVLRTIPPLAWLPISLAIFSDANPSSIFVIFITAIWPILLNTAMGVKQVPQDYINVAKMSKISGFNYFWRILLPAIVPYMFTGLRISIGLAWLAIVAAEMLTGGVGIGFFIWDAWNSLRLSEIIIALIYIGIVGFLLDRLVAFIGNLVTAEE
jgi:nitrate/nitrite transport system permease protein